MAACDLAGCAAEWLRGACVHGGACRVVSDEELTRMEGWKDVVPAKLREQAAAEEAKVGTVQAAASAAAQHRLAKYNNPALAPCAPQGPTQSTASHPAIGAAGAASSALWLPAWGL